MKSKVLIPVDTARNSLTAEEYAIKLNWRMPLEVTLLNVVNTHRLQGHGISPDDQERIRQGMRARAQAVLEVAAKPFASAELDYNTQIEEGSPGQVICKVAEEGGFDMVLIAQSGLSEWEEILGGSVVHQVLQKCQAPVLLVKHSMDQLDLQRRIRSQRELLPG